MNISWANPLWSAILFVIYVTVSCLGLFLIKAAGDWKSTTFAIGFILYGAGALIWMLILRLMPLSIAFPIAAGALVVGTLFIGTIFLSETVTMWHIVGLLMIMVGIVLISISH